MPLRNHFQAYGPTDLEGVDLGSSDDFSPSMMVGYDDDEDMLYVAVIARDDQLHRYGNEIYRDGIEIYVSGLSDGSSPWRTGWPRPTRIIRTVEGYAGSLGNGRNEGDRLVYEWRGKVLDRRRPIELGEGDLIGFDVVAIDNDGNGNVAWVPWGPPVPSKGGSNDRVGRLLLAPAGPEVHEREVLASVLAAWNDGHGAHNLYNLESLGHLALAT